MGLDVFAKYPPLKRRAALFSIFKRWRSARLRSVALRRRGRRFQQRLLLSAPGASFFAPFLGSRSRALLFRLRFFALAPARPLGTRVAAERPDVIGIVAESVNVFDFLLFRRRRLGRAKLGEGHVPAARSLRVVRCCHGKKNGKTFKCRENKIVLMLGKLNESKFLQKKNKWWEKWNVWKNVFYENESEQFYTLLIGFERILTARRKSRKNVTVTLQAQSCAESRESNNFRSAFIQKKTHAAVDSFSAQKNISAINLSITYNKSIN